MIVVSLLFISFGESQLFGSRVPRSDEVNFQNTNQYSIIHSATTSYGYPESFMREVSTAKTGTTAWSSSDPTTLPAMTEVATAAEASVAATTTAPPVPTGSGKTCYYCYHTYDYTTAYLADRFCLSRKDFGEMLDHRRQCAVGENYCVAELVWRSNVVLAVRRDCANDIVCPGGNGGCQHKAYGVDEKTCRRCCNSTFCNSDDDIGFYTGVNGINPNLLFILVTYAVQLVISYE